MKSYTDVEALTVMRDGLLAQGEVSLKSDEDCGIRGLNGMKCALGMLIDDKHYSEDMEGKLVKTLIEDFSDKTLGFNLSDIQDACVGAMAIHDEAEVALWEDEFNNMIEARQCITQMN